MVENKFIFSEIHIKPKIIVSKEAQLENINEMVSLAEKYCLISNSIKCKIIIMSNITVKDT